MCVYSLPVFSSYLNTSLLGKSLHKLELIGYWATVIWESKGKQILKCWELTGVFPVCSRKWVWKGLGPGRLTFVTKSVWLSVQVTSQSSPHLLLRHIHSEHGSRSALGETPINPSLPARWGERTESHSYSRWLMFYRFYRGGQSLWVICVIAGGKGTIEMGCQSGVEGKGKGGQRMRNTLVCVCED